MEPSIRVEEYKSLRAELVSLIEKSFSLWKWGLATLLSMFGVMLFSLEKVTTNTLPKNLNLLQVLFTENSTIFCSILMLFICFVIYTISTIIYSQEDAVDRLGSYLTVFYDSSFQMSDYKKCIGWHAWNRLEKRTRKEYAEKNTQNTTIDISNIVVIVFSQKYIVFYLAICEAMAGVLIGLNYIHFKTFPWVLTCLLELLFCVLWFTLYKSGIKSKANFASWPKRWHALLNSPDGEIDLYLQHMLWKD